MKPGFYYFLGASCMLLAAAPSGCGGCGRESLAGDADRADEADPAPPHGEGEAVEDTAAGDGSAEAVSFPRTWARTYGGAREDAARCILETRDGAFIAAVDTEGWGTGRDVRVFELDEGGNVMWEKSYAGRYDEWVHGIAEAPGGGYVFWGGISSSGPTSYDGWAVRIDREGEVLWQKRYGSEHEDWFYASRPEEEGEGFMMGGKRGTAGSIWLARIDAGGRLLQDVAYEVFPGEDTVLSLYGAPNEGYVAAGWSVDDICVLRLDGEGDVVWAKTYGGQDQGESRCIERTGDGGYIVAGGLRVSGSEPRDAWVLKLDGAGAVEWQRSYGGDEWEGACAVRQVPEGGYVVAGYASSYGQGMHDAWILRLDSSGGIVWQKTYGGEENDEMQDILPTRDGGFIAAGMTGSFGAGELDAWVLKLDADGNVSPDCPEGVGERTYAGAVDTTVRSVSVFPRALEIETAWNDTDAETAGAVMEVRTQCEGY